VTAFYMDTSAATKLVANEAESKPLMAWAASSELVSSGAQGPPWPMITSTPPT